MEGTLSRYVEMIIDYVTDGTDFQYGDNHGVLTRCRGIVREHLKELSDKDLQIMINDCGYQEEFNLYGSKTIDKPGWLKWKEDLLKEKERRNEGTGSV